VIPEEDNRDVPGVVSIYYNFLMVRQEGEKGIMLVLTLPPFTPPLVIPTLTGRWREVLIAFTQQGVSRVGRGEGRYICFYNIPVSI
jgi:hypothetical protein